LINRIETVNRFYKAVALKEESDRTKKRCLDKIRDEIERIARETMVDVDKTGKNGNGATTNVVKEPTKKIKKTKNVSIVHILHGTRNIENEKDLDEVVSVIKEKLKKELEEDTIVKLI
jgi:hypothetical protein